MPDYPLAPQYNYEDAFNMVLPLYEKILEKVKQENLILMGDSAGGGIALALSEKLGEEDFSQPQELILLSPWIDVTMENKEIEKVFLAGYVNMRHALHQSGLVKRDVPNQSASSQTTQ